MALREDLCLAQKGYNARAMKTIEGCPLTGI